MLWLTWHNARRGHFPLRSRPRGATGLADLEQMKFALENNPRGKPVDFTLVAHNGDHRKLRVLFIREALPDTTNPTNK